MNKEQGSGRMGTRLAYLGSGMGLGLFAVFGLMHASFIGGILGINVVGGIFGYPIEPTLISRAIVAFGMLTGVMVCGLAFVLAGAALGWALGTGIEAIGLLHTKHSETH